MSRKVHVRFLGDLGGVTHLSYPTLPVYTALGYRDSEGNLTNRDMDYIRSLHYAAGIQYVPNDAMRLTVEGFYKYYDRYPVSMRTGISLANQGAEFAAVGNERQQSMGTGRVYGAEIFLQQKLMRKLFYVLSTTLYRSEFSGLNRRFIPSSWDYGFIVSSTAGYKFGKGWEAGIKYRIAGGQPYTPFDLQASRRNYLLNGVGTLDFEQLNSERLQIFSQLDFRIDKKVNFRTTSVSFFLDIQNLLLYKTPGLPRYTFSRTDDNSGFATTDGLPLDPLNNNAIPVVLEDRSATVVPSLGFVFEF